MVHITIDDKHIECTGHADREEESDYNLVCGIVSYATQNLIDALDNIANIDIEMVDGGDHGSGHIHAVFEGMNNCGRVLIAAYVLGMTNISQGHTVEISFDAQIFMTDV